MQPAVSSMSHDLFTVNQTAQERVTTLAMNTSDGPLPSWDSQQADEEEAFSFGPEWLKALGATTMDGTEAEIPQSVTESTELDYGQAQPASSLWSQREEEYADEDWTTQVSDANESAILTTLESFERNLYSQGFVPLEPNSLTSIAQLQEASSNETNVPEVLEEEQAQSEGDKEDVRDNASLSSALAQLGRLSTADPAPVRFTAPGVPATPIAPVEPTPAPSTWSAEPSWAAAWRATPQVPAASVFPVPVPASVSPAQPEAVKMTAARAEALLDSELEMTMKRPAVRLQAMSPRATGGPYQNKSASFANKGRVNEPPVPGLQDNYASYREYLVRGYQHQLVGDYDEAMQEYRLIIRSAPELLGEVISNVRALLKLAPKYSAGYRVLGDAYMRQGEYLQAMEAYNKALTMAKKARS